MLWGLMLGQSSRRPLAWVTQDVGVGQSLWLGQALGVLRHGGRVPEGWVWRGALLGVRLKSLCVGQPWLLRLLLLLLMRSPLQPWGRVVQV